MSRFSILVLAVLVLVVSGNRSTADTQQTPSESEPPKDVFPELSKPNPDKPPGDKLSPAFAGRTWGCQGKTS